MQKVKTAPTRNHRSRSPEN